MCADSTVIHDFHPSGHDCCACEDPAGHPAATVPFVKQESKALSSTEKTGTIGAPGVACILFMRDLKTSLANSKVILTKSEASTKWKTSDVSKTRGEIGTKGVDGVVVHEYENICDGVEVDSNKGIRGPDDETEETCGADEEHWGQTPIYPPGTW